MTALIIITLWLILMGLSFILEGIANRIGDDMYSSGGDSGTLINILLPPIACLAALMFMSIRYASSKTFSPKYKIFTKLYNIGRGIK